MPVIAAWNPSRMPSSVSGETTSRESRNERRTPFQLGGDACHRGLEPLHMFLSLSGGLFATVVGVRRNDLSRESLRETHIGRGHTRLSYCLGIS